MTLRLGIIGVGTMGSDHARRIAETINGATLAGVSDLIPERAQAIHDKFGAKIYEDGLDLVRDPQIDAVVVATAPHETHEQFVLEAIKLGKYVLSEKPLTTSAAGCRKIVDAEIAAGKRLVQVGFMRRYDKGYQEIRKAIVSGELGEPLLIHCAHRNMTTPPVYNSDMSIVETAIHEVDVLHYLLGENYESALTFLPKKQTRYTHEGLHDPQIVELDTESGVHIDLEVFVNNQMGYDINCRVVFEKGEIALHAPQNTIVKVAESERERIPAEYTERFRQAYDTEFQAFVDGVANDALTGPTAWDGLVACVTCDALFASRDEGGVRKQVELPETPQFYIDNHMD
ncbi:inositol 2-dehydrogenase [Bifidobacterium callitrichos]|uniref:Inositol 2-dehydrogenase n=1 Tax=Bifidobacterium callitrichos TaxID=762209 RepID=A0A2T3GDD3_9BIFI|nr:Gfo/Idh/MocA family oxidoreductase [Bifidobacterium callitrichos]KAA8815790.1 Gfo/Idh/MocA family oxidoreductase [Bifidobacterium callitrichos]PST47411.1 inositol 2-dehydrogenase [Bifidobacterium callitrichos]